MITNYNIFFCDKLLLGFIIRKLERTKQYHILEFTKYEDFTHFLNNNTQNSLFNKIYYIFILFDSEVVDTDLLSNYDLDGHILITNKYTNITNATQLNLLSKNLSSNNFNKLIQFLVTNVNKLYIEKLTRENKFDVNTLCYILEYMDITDSELPYPSYISAVGNNYVVTVNDVISLIEDSSSYHWSKLSSIHPGIIALYLQKKLISNIKVSKKDQIMFNKLISIYENDKYVKNQANVANYLLKLRFLADKLS